MMTQPRIKSVKAEPEVNNNHLMFPNHSITEGQDVLVGAHVPHVAVGAPHDEGEQVRHHNDQADDEHDGQEDQVPLEAKVSLMLM